MSGIDKTNLPKSFGEIYRDYGNDTSTEHVRGKEDGRLYVHGKKMHNLFKKDERLQKYELGARNVRQTIDQEYGEGVGAKVFRKVSQSIGTRDLNDELQRRDLPLIKDELDKGELSGLLEPTTPFKARLDENQRCQLEIFDGPLGNTDDPSGSGKLLGQFFGAPLSDSGLRGLCGLPDTCDLALQRSPHGDRVQLSLVQDSSGAFSSGTTTISRGQDDRVSVRQSMSFNTELKSGEAPPTDLECCAIVRVVDWARTLNVGSLQISSDGLGPHGHVILARCGGDAPIHTDEVRTRHPQDYERFMQALRDSPSPLIQELAGKNDLTVQDFMKTDEGRQFWEEHGFALPLAFDLTTGAPTLRMMQDYTVPKSCFDLRQL